MKKKFLVSLAALLYLLVVLPSNVYADDNFIYGVQIFNRPIDWYWDSYNQSKEAGTEAVRQIISYAAELNADLVRGCLQYSNMYSQLKIDGEHDMWGLRLLLPLLAEKNLILDWVISGTDSNLGMANPPDFNEWQELISYGAGIVSSAKNQPEVIYEIWNEPDLPGLYWNGTCEDYYDKYLTSAVSVIRQADNNARVINGGLVLGNTEGEAEEYMQRAASALRNGQISMLAIHAHDPFYKFMELMGNENFSGIEMSKIFLNECGYAWNTEGGKEFNTAAKILGAKALGMKGIVVFHMGLKSSLLKDEIERGSQLLNISENGIITPTDTYNAVKAAIRFTKGLIPDAGNNLSASDKGYVWLFTDGKKKTLACIGRSPSENELAGLESDSYEIYDIYGNEITAGSVNHFDIVYYITSFNDEPVPQTPAITITTGQSEFDAKDCIVNNEYSFELKSNPSGALWSVENGNLPDGLYIQGSKITGIPSRAGKYDFTLLAELNGYESSRADFSITVKSPVMQTISIRTDKLRDATEGKSYNVRLESDPSGASWSCNNLPDGLTITSSSSSGRLKGKPSARGKYTLNITASKEGWLSSTVDIDLTVKENIPSPEPANPEQLIPPEIITEKIDGGKFGESYNFALKSDTEGVKWILEDENSLPEGLSLNENTGIISGIPKKTGKFEFTVYAEKDDLISESKTFTITIDYAGKIEILTTQEDFNASGCKAGRYYSIELESNPSSVKWSKSDGDFPQGLTLQSSGTITGIPASAGTYNFTLLAELEGYESSSSKFRIDVTDDSDNNGNGNNNDNGNDNNNGTQPKNPGKSGGGGGCNSFHAVNFALIVIMLLKRR